MARERKELQARGEGEARGRERGARALRVRRARGAKRGARPQPPLSTIYSRRPAQRRQPPEGAAGNRQGQAAGRRDTHVDVDSSSLKTFSTPPSIYAFDICHNARAVLKSESAEWRPSPTSPAPAPSRGGLTQCISHWPPTGHWPLTPACGRRRRPDSPRPRPQSLRARLAPHRGARPRLAAGAPSRSPRALR